MKIISYFALVFILFISSSLFAQEKSHLELKLDSLEVAIQRYQPLRIYIQTRFDKNFQVNEIKIKHEILTIIHDGKELDFYARDLKQVSFLNPHPWWKWVGACSGAILSVGGLFLLDENFNSENKKFSGTPYILGSTIGGVIGYMIGRGIGGTMIEITF